MHIAFHAQTQGKDNNFNLIRIAAAFAVLISHSFPLANGSGFPEPFSKLIGMSMGQIAVDIFFVTSGFLVSASIQNRNNLLEFVLARFLRIYPAMLVMVLLTVFGLGIFFTTLPIGDYLSDHKTHRYLFRGLTIIGGVWFDLPGVFKNIPYAGTINGSLWTLPFELRMYLLLGFTWLIFRPLEKSNQFFRLAIIFIAITSYIFFLFAHFHILEKNDFLRFCYWFFIGSTFYVIRRKIYLSHLLACIIIIAFI